MKYPFRFDIDPSMPAPFIPLIKSLVKRLQVLIPPSVESIYVSWDPERDAGMASSHDRSYRQISLVVTPQTFETPDHSLRYFVHEFGHWFTARMLDAALDCIREIIGPDHPTPGSRVAEIHLRTILEQQNTDLEGVLMKLLEAE